MWFLLFTVELLSSHCFINMLARYIYVHFEVYMYSIDFNVCLLKRKIIFYIRIYKAFMGFSVGIGMSKIEYIADFSK